MDKPTTSTWTVRLAALAVSLVLFSSYLWFRISYMRFETFSGTKSSINTAS